MTTPINNLQGILDAMKRNPVFAKELRRHVRSNELMHVSAGSQKTRESSTRA